MILEDLDTSAMRFDPKSETFVQDVDKAIPELTTINTLPLKKKEFYRYAALMYDPNSPIIEVVDDYWQRKFEAAETAGFKVDKDGKFEQKVDDMVLGMSEKHNEFLIVFLSFIGKAKWKQLVFFQTSLATYNKRTFRGEELLSKDIEVVNKLHSNIYEVQNELLIHGDETDRFLDSFYYRIEKARLAVRPEDYAKRLANGDDLQEDSPYGEDYKVDPIKFVGENKPSIQKRKYARKRNKRS